MTKEEMTQRSIEKVKTKLLKDLERSPKLINACFEAAQNEFELELVDEMIDCSFNIKRKYGC